MAAGWSAVGGRLPAPTTVSTMHSHNLTLALAEARSADVRRAVTRNMATAPPRRHRRALALVALAAIAGLTALAPTGALAQPMRDTATPATAHIHGTPTPTPPQDRRALANTSSLAGTTAARHAGQAGRVRQSLQSPDARDAAEGRGAFNSPDVVVVKAQPQTRPALTNGIDWSDAGIGAGGLLGMSLLGLGGMLLIRHHRRAVPDTVTPSPR
jgi:hypothetical protein